jgi:hypothetical protein
LRRYDTDKPILGFSNSKGAKKQLALKHRFGWFSKVLYLFAEHVIMAEPCSLESFEGRKDIFDNYPHAQFMVFGL